MDSNNVEEMESFVTNESENKSCSDKIKNHQGQGLYIIKIWESFLCIIVLLIISMVMIVGIGYGQFENSEEACSGVLCANAGEKFCEGAATFINRNGNETR